MTKGVVISGTGSGVGKTSIVTGLLSKLSKTKRVQAFKVGPDFIDPMYHSVATGIPARNLDTFLMEKDTVRNLVGYACDKTDADLCVVEGVRGLYEGLSGTSDECSTAEMAKALGFPVVLVVNARSLTRSAAAVINGFKSFDPDVDIRGVILNNVSGSQHENKLREAIEKYTDVDIVGIVRRSQDKVIGQRHLGLNTINSDGKEEIEHLEGLVDEIDMDRLMDVCDVDGPALPHQCPYTRHNSGLTAAVPMDDAFCFYYRENIECMEAAGMKVKYFSPVKGEMIPDADVYFLGGGYPELFTKEISDNRDFLEGLNTASADGKVVMGECGGLTAMCSSLTGTDGVKRKMADIFNADAKMSGRHGPTYVIAETTKDNPLFRDMTVKGHEFHYTEIQPNNGDLYGYRILRGTGICDKMDGLTVRNTIGSYMHQHALSTKDWLSGVIERAE